MATLQLEAETYASQIAGNTGRQGAETGERGAAQTTNKALVMANRERTGAPPTTLAHPDTTTDTAHGGTQEDRPPEALETKDVLALIFDKPVPAAGQKPATDEHLHDAESFNACMASCREGAPATESTRILTPRRTTPPAELAATVQERACASHEAHLRRNYATLEPMAANCTAAAGDDHARRQPTETTSQP